MRDVFVEQLPDHLLILHVMLVRGRLEVGNGLRAEMDGYLGLLGCGLRKM
jgi:hypothetical protein